MCNVVKKMEINFCGICFKNPIVVASTDIGRRTDTFRKYAEAGVGGIITKSVTDAVELQNKGITMFDIMDMELNDIHGEIPNSYYFFSRGGSMVPMAEFKETAKEQLRVAKEYEVVPIGSISCSKLENWVAYAKEFEKMGFPMIELNFGNPHGEAAKGKLGFLIGQSKELATSIAFAVATSVKIPVIVKMTPQVDSIVSMAEALQGAGIKGVTIMHRFQGMVIDHETETPKLGGYAAIGGPWMKPLSLANISKVFQSSYMQIMGSNGVDTAEDVLDYIYAGATLVQIGSTFMLRGPEYAEKLIKSFENLITEKGGKIDSKIGLVSNKVASYKNLHLIHPRKTVIDGDICQKCESKKCIGRCHYGALSLKEGKIYHDDNLCSGCGMCHFICDKNAASIEEIKEV